MRVNRKIYSVSTFGGLGIILPDGAFANLQTQRSRALFVLLLLSRDQMLHREVICDALWPELAEPAARAQLRKALWRIRSALGPECDNGVLRVADHLVGLDGACLNADCWRFADLTAPMAFKPDRDLDRADAEALAAAVEISHDTFAAGIFDDWCLSVQSKLREARLIAIERIVGFHRRQENWLQAIQWANRALRADPLREHLHLAVMASWISLGDRASALRQYADCARILRRELDVEPSAPILDLRTRIAGHAPCAAPKTDQPKPNGTRRTRVKHRELNAVAASLGTAQVALQRLIDSV